MANIFKIFVTVFLVDVFTNVAFAYMVGVEPTQQVFLMSAIFSLIVALLLNSLGVIGRSHIPSLPVPKIG